MQKLQMMSKDRVQANIEKIKQIFPNAVTEVVRDGKTTLAVDFDVLKQEMSDTLVNDKEQRYQFTWPDKFQALRLANERTTSTLRPCKEESVNFDTTQNLYIEGDNLDVLKLLQENYLGKIKMIYIDPPYNTGNDFVYKDNFAMSSEEYLENSDQFDEDGNRLVQNTESNGRFHTDWLNMIYPRLKIARDLLTDDGVIFISIDDNEQENLKKVCDEIFGEDNFESAIKWRRRSNQPNDATKMVATVSEYIIVYAKSSSYLKETKNFGTVALSDERLRSYSNPDNDPRGDWSTTPWCASKGQGGCTYSIVTPMGEEYTEVWLGTEETFLKLLQDNRIVFTSGGHGKPRKKVFKSEAIERGQAAIDFCVGDRYGDNLTATEDMKKIFKMDRVFDYSKPIKLIATLLKLGIPRNGIILDFFSGSATTAHAVMQLNAEDGGNRKFIMVQLPEACNEKSEAYRAGYKNICEIGKERIRRAGKKILQEQANLVNSAQSGALVKGEDYGEFSTSDTAIATQEQVKSKLDVGFRVLKLDSSNVKDVYYHSDEYSQDMLDVLEDNVKQDRSPMDLLFQAMLEFGVSLSAKIEEKQIDGKQVFCVDGNELVACFDSDVSEEVVKTIAQTKPTRAVFRDSSFATDSAHVNFDQIFATYSPNTIRRVI